MKNDIIIIDKVEKQLRQKRSKEDNIFPLSPTHRKELRKLKNDNISGLRQRVRNIRELKKNDFLKRYEKEIKIEVDSLEPQIIKLNKAFISFNEMIGKGINTIKTLQNNSSMEYISIETNYNEISKLNNEGIKRIYSLNKHSVNEILSKQFNDKFNIKFENVNNKIDKMLEQYEEAINFGDLELVKELYYSLKDADSFLNEISDLKI